MDYYKISIIYNQCSEKLIVRLDVTLFALNQGIYRFSFLKLLNVFVDLHVLYVNTFSNIMF